MVVRSRRGHVALAEPDASDDAGAASTVSVRSFQRRAPLPAVGAAGCVPRPGWACWRGRLRLSTEVWRGWKVRRAKARTARHVDEGGEEDGTGGGIAVSGDTSVNSDEALAEAPDDDVDPVTDLAEVPLPPDSGFRAFFDVRVFRMDGTNESLNGVDGAGRGAPSVELSDDGSFEVHVPPGRYGLEAQSRDDLVIGGRDALPAIASATDDGVDITLGPTVVLAGRVLDEDGVMMPATVTAARIGDEESTAMVHGAGTFRFDGLRTGTFRLTAEAQDQSSAAVFSAPLEGAVLRLPRTRAGLLVLPRGPDGRCGRATVIAMEHVPDDGPTASVSSSRAAGIRRQRMQTSACQVVLQPVAPGSEWDVFMLQTGAPPIKARVQFGFESPAAPVCLVAGCSTAAAALQIVATDIDGRGMEGEATLTATSPGEEANVSTVHGQAVGLPVNQSVTVELRLGDLTISRQVWLQAGVNRAVIQFPLRRQDVPEQGEEIGMLR